MWATKDHEKVGQTEYQPFVTWLVPDPNGTFMGDDGNYRDETEWGPDYKSYASAKKWIERQTQGDQGAIERAKWTEVWFDDGEYGQVADADVEHTTVAYAWRGKSGAWFVEKEV